MSILINLGPNLAIYAKNQMEQNSKTIKNLAHLTIYVKMGNNAVKKKTNLAKLTITSFLKLKIMICIFQCQTLSIDSCFIIISNLLNCHF